MDKLSIQNELKCFDKKDRTFYTSLSDEEKKKFSNYLMIRWGSTVQESQDLQEFYIISCNERLNKHFFNINKHPELQWLCASTVSPGLKVYRHEWISMKKKEPNADSVKKHLTELFPNMREDDLNVMALINTKKDINNYKDKLGL